MPEGKRARTEGTKCPCAALLPEAIFNYVVSVEEYVFCFLLFFLYLRSFNSFNFDHGSEYIFLENFSGISV